MIIIVIDYTIQLTASIIYGRIWPVFVLLEYFDSLYAVDFTISLIMLATV